MPLITQPEFNSSAVIN